MIKFLGHIRILDLSRLLPGAQCTQLLADLGAEVLKVEEPQRGDYIRHLNPWVFGATNRNKKSLTLNLKHPKGREILLKLAQNYDVLLESFRPGVMERLGLGYPEVQKANPGIIYCSLSGYGQDGPYRLRSGHDLNYLAVGGILGLSSDPGEPPHAPPIPIADLAGSLAASHAILAALTARAHSNRGCYIDAALMDTALWLFSIRLAPGMGTGKMTHGELVRGGAYDTYRTRDGRYLALGIIEDKFWRNLCKFIRHPELTDDPRFATDAQRTKNRLEIRKILEPFFAGRDLKDWMETGEADDIPMAPILAMDEVANDPQVKHRGLIFELAGEAGRPCRQVAYPARFPGQEKKVDQSPPGLGAHNREVLVGLGYGEKEIQFLKSEKVI
jgi:crotonobetainyl-CoA:carnitine CoA-transferase CaiB-like acyl-CoA transferase